jgi:TRAP-type C4-dicarboxylate transport system substrate-binding protein
MTLQNFNVKNGVLTMSKKHVKWVLAHEPIELFIRAAKVFAAEVNARAPEQLEIEVMTMSEYSQKYNGGVLVTKHELVDLLDSGKIEMSQTYTITLGKINKDFFALDLPFLFKDHDHASRVFEGDVGASLLDSLQETKKIKGLAFTYSGGFRIIPGNEPVARIEDLRGIKVRTSHSPVAIETFRTLGADVVPMELEELSENLGSANVAVGESTYPRVYALGHDKVSKVINHTEHSLFLTSILIGTDFWNTLSADLQAVVAESAKVAARYERVISIDDVAKTQARAEADGIEVIKMSKEEQARFAAETKVVYDKFENYFTAGLVKSIQSK